MTKGREYRRRERKKESEKGDEQEREKEGPLRGGEECCGEFKLQSIRVGKRKRAAGRGREVKMRVDLGDLAQVSKQSDRSGPSKSRQLL